MFPFLPTGVAFAEVADFFDASVLGRFSELSSVGDGLAIKLAVLFPRDKADRCFANAPSPRAVGCFEALLEGVPATIDVGESVSEAGTLFCDEIRFF